MYGCELEGVKFKVFLFFGEGRELCKLFGLLCNYFFLEKFDRLFFVIMS